MKEKDTLPGKAAEEEQSEDTRAILSRREFLIKSALLSVGIAAVGCGDDSKSGSLSDAAGVDQPQPCLSQACLGMPQQDATELPQPCLDRVPEDMAVDCLSIGDIGKPDPDQAVVCLEPPLPDVLEDTPQPCLDPLPEDTADTTPDFGQPCLSPPLKDVEDVKEDQPQICLSPRPEDVQDAKEDLPQICLSIIPPDTSDDDIDAA